MGGVHPGFSHRIIKIPGIFRNPGFPPANRDKVFTPFFTTNRENGGTGLGLRIVQTMIESHSGKIDLGETQKGTLFTLQLPLIN